MLKVRPATAPRFLSTVKRSPIGKRSRSDNLGEVLAHYGRGSKPGFCGHSFHCQLCRFQQALAHGGRARARSSWLESRQLARGSAGLTFWCSWPHAVR